MDWSHCARPYFQQVKFLSATKKRNLCFKVAYFPMSLIMKRLGGGLDRCRKLYSRDLFPFPPPLVGKSLPDLVGQLAIVAHCAGQPGSFLIRPSMRHLWFPCTSFSWLLALHHRDDPKKLQ